MASNNGIPDAWDADYEAVADGKASPSSAASSAPIRVSRAERRAQHQAANKQLWESAENPQPFHYVEARGGGVALINADLKPALKVLSRKPIKPASLENSMKVLKVEDDDIDSEEEERRVQARSLEQRQIKAAAERVEKQRKYAERREQLFGPSASNSTPASTSGRNSPAPKLNGKTKTTGDKRGGGGPGRDSSSATPADQSPARSGPGRQLYDPSSADRPRFGQCERRDNDETTGTALKPTRSPRGPDGSGRGGFGFAARGGKTNT